MTDNAADNSNNFPKSGTQISLKTKCKNETITLTPMAPKTAAILGPRCAAIDPWKTYQTSPQALTEFFASIEQSAPHYAILKDTDPVGAICLRLNWLRGPYLQFLCVLPEAQGRGIGAALLDWLEASATSINARHVWIMVSEFNAPARAFYARKDYEEVASIPDVVADGFNEILLRKKLA